MLQRLTRPSAADRRLLQIAMTADSKQPSPSPSSSSSPLMFEMTGTVCLCLRRSVSLPAAYRSEMRSNYCQQKKMTSERCQSATASCRSRFSDMRKSICRLICDRHTHYLHHQTALASLAQQRIHIHIISRLHCLQVSTDESSFTVSYSIFAVISRSHADIY